MADRVRILMVEYENEALALSQTQLTGEGYEVLCAKTIREARGLFWEYPPHLIVLNVQMPDGCGYDFCREIRAISTAPVLLLSCQSGPEQVIRGLSEGGDDFMEKPYDMGVLIARIRSLLNRCGIIGAGRIELPPLTLDFQTGRASLCGVDIPLSQKELQLLAFLAAHAGQVFSSEKLYRAVWGDEAQVQTSTVKVHISNLRKKLLLDDSGPFELCFTADQGYMLLRTAVQECCKVTPV